MIKEHFDLGFFKENSIFFILGKPMGEREGEIHPFSAAKEGPCHHAYICLPCLPLLLFSTLPLNIAHTLLLLFTLLTHLLSILIPLATMLTSLFPLFTLFTP